MKPQSLPGYVPSSSTLVRQEENRSKAQFEGATKSGLRADFANALEQRLSGWLGQHNSEKFKNLQPLAEPYLKAPSEGGEMVKFDLSKLPTQTQDELVKLQRATENIESLFVKKLLSQMRSVSFDGEKKDQMASFTQDLMDQSIADRASKNGSSIGISKMIFLDTAQTIVRSSISKPQGNKDKH